MNCDNVLLHKGMLKKEEILPKKALINIFEFLPFENVQKKMQFVSLECAKAYKSDELWKSYFHHPKGQFGDKKFTNKTQPIYKFIEENSKTIVKRAEELHEPIYDEFLREAKENLDLEEDYFFV